MNAHRVLRPALKLVTAAALVVVSTAGAVSTSTTADAGDAPARAPYVASKIDNVAVRVSPSFASSTYERKVQYWVNVQRRHHGLRALRLATCTDRVAERWSSHLASSDTFYHQSMTKAMYKCNAYYAGETLGRGSIKPRTLVTMWMHSPPHRHVLMSRSPRRIGVGATPNARGEWVTCANFMRF
jgi:uncharacterized protein YkwD